MQSRRAGALAELGLAMPVLVVFATLTHQVWGLIEINRILDTAARDAARYASLQLPPMSNITPLVNQYVANKLVPNSRLKQFTPSAITVNVQRLGSGGTNPEDTEPKGYVNPGDVLRVSINLKANQSGGFYSYLLGPSPTTIVRSAAYAQANPTITTAEPTPTPTPTPTPSSCPPVCCNWKQQLCLQWCIEGCVDP